MAEQAPIYRLISHMKKHRSTMWLATLFSILNKIFDLAPPLLIGAAVDVVVMQEKSALSNYGYTDPKDLPLEKTPSDIIKQSKFTLSLELKVKLISSLFFSIFSIL